MSPFQRFLLITIAATFVLVVIGGTVRATGSGLGCPDWPTCHGQIIPPAEKHTLIEFSHRTAAAVVGVLFLGVTYFTFRSERRRPEFWMAFTAGLLLVAQIILGGVTVKTELPSEVVAAHLAVAMAFVGLLIVTLTVSTMRSRSAPLVASGATAPFARLAVLSAGVAFLTLVLGSYISESDAALACSGWPLCNGSLVPGGDSAVGLHFLHRLLAGLLGVLLVGLAYQAWEERRPRVLVITSTLAVGAWLVQALVGAANIWTELADGVVVAHLGLAAVLWGLLVWLSTAALYSAGVAPERASGEQAGVGKAAEWA